MHWLYGIVGILAVLAGGLTLLVAPAVTQQIAGILCVLLGFLLMAVADGLGRLSAIHRTLAEIRDQGRPGTAAEETRTRPLAEALASRQSRG